MLAVSTMEKSVKIDVLMLQITTYFATSKYTSQGFLSRDTWHTTNGKIKQLLELLADKVFDAKALKKAKKDAN